MFRFCVYRGFYLVWPPAIINYHQYRHMTTQPPFQGPQSRLGDKLLGIRVACPQNGTAVLQRVKKIPGEQSKRDEEKKGVKLGPPVRRLK